MRINEGPDSLVGIGLGGHGPAGPNGNASSNAPSPSTHVSVASLGSMHQQPGCSPCTPESVSNRLCGASIITILLTLLGLVFLTIGGRNENWYLMMPGFMCLITCFIVPALYCYERKHMPRGPQDSSWIRRLLLQTGQGNWDRPPSNEGAPPPSDESDENDGGQPPDHAGHNHNQERPPTPDHGATGMLLLSGSNDSLSSTSSSGVSSMHSVDSSTTIGSPKEKLPSHPWPRPLPIQKHRYPVSNLAGPFHHNPLEGTAS